MLEIHSKRIKVGELDIHYFTGGHGDPLLIIHGGSEGAKAWEKTAAELIKKYRIYVPDLPGFGHSQEMKGNYYIPELVKFVNGFADELGLVNFHLMGHSLGGGIALHYALEFPHRVKKLVLVNSMFLGKEIALWVRVFSMPPFRHTIGATTLGILRGVKWMAERLSAPPEFLHPFPRASISLGSKVASLKEQTTVLAHRLSEIMVPTLVVWGAKDPILPVSQAYAAAQLIPDCQIKVFKDGGHSVYRQKIAEFCLMLARFLG
jgi:4,5:9,10-diseco-3-hydroxy-5,9,17-trioxoandrosta-1(10),2-diene-4-oate hydrolase